MANLEVGFETEETTDVLCFPQTGWAAQHWGSSAKPTPCPGTHGGSRSGFPFPSPRGFGQPGQERHQPSSAGVKGRVVHPMGPQLRPSPSPQPRAMQGAR